jgi:hypothetical protein
MFKIIGHGSKSENKTISLEVQGNGFIQKQFWKVALVA